MALSEKRKEYLAKYRLKNRDRIRAQQKKWEDENIDKENDRKRAWRDMNPEKVKSSYQRYAAKQPEGYEFNRKLKYKYDISREDYDKILLRQKNTCPIRQTTFTPKGSDRPHVDHCHSSGSVRAVLSNNANTAIGLLNEDPEAFYRAVAYLTLDPNKPLVYIMGSLRNEGVEEVASKVRSLGYDVFDNWFSAGREADDYWQKYSKNKGLSYTEALQSREANHVFRFDKAYLDLCDAAILVMPAGKSGFLELGYLLGRGTPAYLLLDEDTEKNRYDVMPQFANIVTSDLSIITDGIKERTKDFARL